MENHRFLVLMVSLGIVACTQDESLGNRNSVFDDIRTLDLSGLENVVVSDARISSRSLKNGKRSEEQINSLYTYNKDGVLELLQFQDIDGKPVEYVEEFQPHSVFDFPSYLVVNFDTTDSEVSADRLIIVEKSSGGAFKLDSGRILIDYNHIYAFDSIHETQNGELYIYAYNPNNKDSGFYKLKIANDELVASLIFPYESSCNRPDFLADKFGNFLYEDGCRPMKIITHDTRFSTITPGTFDYGTIKSSQNELVNEKIRLNPDGISYTTFTNGTLMVKQSDLVKHGENVTYVASREGVTVWDESNTNPDTNITNHFPEDGWEFTDSSDFNDMLIIDNKAYIGTSTGLALLYLDGTKEAVSNVLDEVYNVKSMTEEDGVIVFSGIGPFLDSVIAEYDPISGETTVTQSVSEDVEIILTKVN